MDEQSTPGVGDQAWLVFSWLWVGAPLAWGVFETVRKSLALLE